MSNATIRQVIILGALIISGMIGLQGYWLMSSWNVNEEEFQSKVTLALQNVARALAAYSNTTLPLDNLVKKRTANYFVVDIQAEIDANVLEFYLKRELSERGLHLDFEYAVFDCTTNEWLYNKYISYTPGIVKESETANLPKYDEFTYYFGVKFPTRPGYLLGQMQLSLIFAGILLITISFFIYAMSTILRQKRLSEMQKDFINNMTHEFKTPISTIRISAEVFLNDPLVLSDERLTQYARIIREQNQRLNHQVEKVLQLAKEETNSFELKIEKLDLGQLVLAVTQNLEVRLEENQGTLKVNVPPVKIMVAADDFHLKNILYSLLDNSMKYCKRAPALEVSLELVDKLAVLSIQDNGIGIPKAYQHKIFEKFFRVPTGNIHDVKGFGLGLYYVKEICHAHRWKIKLESEEEKGTRVSIMMPVKKSDLP
ncbi:MAG: HAMP domain-containing histidine kinase [Saprospiraceae bacterium]|jgi:two-component system, OmpR family, phosphate regulon sensor histidine kinase PhoR|nr:HAMP domain-containing histidine kinase [Saprospiraceae bacterium]MDP4819893.1 HAMP domain-containing histidine kinase [Saprospiraceae bacterium]MDP5000185.1 HAMP domain-containing histidine kinase [Saprospiraceae bacterium]